MDSPLIHQQISQRVLKLIASQTEPKRRLADLQNRTGISSANWKHVWARRQRPTAMMIQALCLAWPQYAFWLVTGISSGEIGCYCPGGLDSTEVQSWADIEKSAREAIRQEKIASATLMLESLD
jgi:hypothetical protein